MSLTVTKDASGYVVVEPTESGTREVHFENIEQLVGYLYAEYEPEQTPTAPARAPRTPKTKTEETKED